MKRVEAKRARLLREIQGCSEMLQGSLVVLYRKCGKKGCRCERGEKHGPAYYLSYKEGGVTRMVYIPVSRLEEVKKAMEAFSRYWELGVKLSRLNLEHMGLSKSTRRDHGRGVAWERKMVVSGGLGRWRRRRPEGCD